MKKKNTNIYIYIYINIALEKCLLNDQQQWKCSGMFENRNPLVHTRPDRSGPWQHYTPGLGVFHTLNYWITPFCPDTGKEGKLPARSPWPGLDGNSRGETKNYRHAKWLCSKNNATHPRTVAPQSTRGLLFWLSHRLTKSNTRSLKSTQTDVITDVIQPSRRTSCSSHGSGAWLLLPPPPPHLLWPRYHGP
jgi:hypothetical protein